MLQTISLRLLPHEAADNTTVKNYIAKTLSKKFDSIIGFYFLKKSIDARSKKIWINLTVLAFIDEPFIHRNLIPFNYNDVHQSDKKVIIIGAGPAGLFAALRLLEAGIKPIILERGKDVRQRRRDLALLNKEGVINPDSNYCFGEGGAGTYSDGKLYTRSSKRGSIDKILNLFVQFGADEKILYEAHPHIGTNKLPHIITAMRYHIIAHGGEIIFEQRVVDFIVKNNQITSVKTANGNTFEANAFVLATGHSARDIFELLHNKKILIEPKPFALGVRIEHPQNIIDNIQYHCDSRSEFLPPASYSLVQQVNNKGVFSFCMCPGGIIAPAATAANELVVNGWSPSKRNNPFANSGMVVEIQLEDVIAASKKNSEIIDTTSPLMMMQFQQSVERKAYELGGGNFVAPAQRMVDFTNKTTSTSLPDCSYQRGLTSVSLNNVLPPFVFNALSKGFVEFGKKMKGYFTNDAVIVATESRTSSPVKIPREADNLQHPQINNLYPCGEGAGYAGGIVSAAMDGDKVAATIAHLIN